MNVKMRLWKFKVKQWYDEDYVQLVFAFLIMLNFISEIIASTDWARENKSHQDILAKVEWIFVVIFSIELIINMYGNWFKYFWRKNWNIFDFVVVGGSWFFPLMSVRMARILRIIRVLRVSGRFQAVRTMIVTMSEAITAVLAISSILFLVMMIYAVLAFNTYGLDCKYRDQTKDGEVMALQCEMFGDIGSSVLYMFHISTLEGWGDVLPIVKAYWHAPFFFISYVIMTAFLMLNVVVAIVLDKMTIARVIVQQEDELGRQLHLEHKKELEAHLSKLKGAGPDELKAMYKKMKAHDKSKKGKSKAIKVHVRECNERDIVQVVSERFDALEERISMQLGETSGDAKTIKAGSQRIGITGSKMSSDTATMGNSAETRMPSKKLDAIMDALITLNDQHYAFMRKQLAQAREDMLDRPIVQ